MCANAIAQQIPPPPFRRLRTYAFDPSLAAELDTVSLNQATLRIPWEKLDPGPVGEYLEVVDFDPASSAFYPPVDLNNANLLAQDGEAPSEGNPLFHQQMVYAVAMKTIDNFEHALGRLVLWAPHLTPQTLHNVAAQYVPRLRIYPHALREANAYYSPQKAALLFGYFPASQSEPGGLLPGGIVFSCLSHDIVAHETTHALLDGLHRRFVEPSNRDALAFHEAFADLVALFQHFTLPEAVRHQIARTRGDLGQQNLLGDLARQFGQAIGKRGSLRSAIGLPADPSRYEMTLEPHDRGAILVAAVFDAFLSIYKRRIADLLRIATNGRGILPEGQIHPDLVNRLANEAVKSASHVLRMCIRALDYCPPVDLTFGDYLRALVTADEDLVPDDDLAYRVAIIDAFRRHGIYPSGVRSLAIDSLRWSPPQRFPQVKEVSKLHSGWDLSSARDTIHRQVDDNCRRVWNWLKSSAITRGMAAEMGLALENTAPQTIARSARDHLPKVEVHSVRPARRIGPDGQHLTDLIIEITQSRRGYIDPQRQKNADSGRDAHPDRFDFTFRGGCTLLVNIATGSVRYCITKNILGENRMSLQRALHGPSESQSLRATYFGEFADACHGEPFALLHRGL